MSNLVAVPALFVDHLVVAVDGAKKCSRYLELGSASA